MHVMPSHPYEREHTMTQEKSTAGRATLKALLADDQDLMRHLVREVMQEILEAEMTDALSAEPGERTEARLGYRAGHYPRTLITRVGKLELRVPRDRDGRFSTELFERYQRSEKALVSALAEMYVQGVSTRKVKAITEELCGHSFSASAISSVNKGLDEGLSQFAKRRLDEPYPYLILDARYERVREGGVIRSQAVLIAIGINTDGYRQILGVELASRESRGAGGTSSLLFGSAACTGSNSWSLTITWVCERASWRSCRRRPGNAATCTSCATLSITCPARPSDDCLQELRWLYDRRDLAEAQKDLSAWICRWQRRLSAALRLGRGEHRRDPHLLPAPLGPSQAPEEHQHAGDG